MSPFLFYGRWAGGQFSSDGMVPAGTLAIRLLALDSDFYHDLPYELVPAAGL
jgi:hypothetical protein